MLQARLQCSSAIPGMTLEGPCMIYRINPGLQNVLFRRAFIYAISGFYNPSRRFDLGNGSKSHSYLRKRAAFLGVQIPLRLHPHIQFTALEATKGKSIVYLVNSHTNATSKSSVCGRLTWRFAPGLPSGLCRSSPQPHTPHRRHRTGLIYACIYIYTYKYIYIYICVYIYTSFF